MCSCVCEWNVYHPSLCHEIMLDFLLNDFKVRQKLILDWSKRRCRLTLKCRHALGIIFSNVAYLDIWCFFLFFQGIPTMPMDRGRTGHPAGGSGIQTVENRTYAPLSGSDGDTETDNPQSPIQMLIHQPSPHLNLPSSLGRMPLPLQRGPSTSSSDNNSDVTFPDSDMAIMRGNGIVDRNGKLLLFWKENLTFRRISNRHFSYFKQSLEF